MMIDTGVVEIDIPGICPHQKFSEAFCSRTIYLKADYFLVVLCTMHKRKNYS